MEKILKETNELIVKHDELKNIIHLSEETLKLAKAIDQLDNVIKDITIDEVSPSYEERIKVLNEKYITAHQDFIQEIESLQGKPLDEDTASKVEEDIDTFAEKINCYFEYISNCTYKVSQNVNKTLLC